MCPAWATLQTSRCRYIPPPAVHRAARNRAPLLALRLKSRICAVLTRISGRTCGVKCARARCASSFDVVLDSAIHLSVPPSRSDTVSVSEVVEREVSRAARMPRHRRSARRVIGLPLPGFRTSPASRRPVAVHLTSPCAVRPVRRAGQSVNPVCVPIELARSRPT